jgi:membrane protease YdiL (CAAX protease family)
MPAPLFLLANPRSDLGVGFDGVLGAVVKVLLPVVAYLLCAPLIHAFFRKTWRELDAEATDQRQANRLLGLQDHRPAVMFAIVAVILTAQEYYGGGPFFAAYIRPWLRDVELMQIADPGGWGQHVDLRFWGEMYSYGWWALTRVLGYSVVPLLAWKLIYRKDSLLDVGALRIKGLREHAWIYGMCLGVVVPVVFIVSRSPDFASYYPFYKQCSRSWLDFIIWESMYVGQFFALEVFFRGFMLVPLRKTLGSYAVFAMCVPYVMIHFGKPYLEASAAFIAGVALGSLAMKTRSIYSGFLVHVTVALLMDVLALAGGPGLPTAFWPR